MQTRDVKGERNNLKEDPDKEIEKKQKTTRVIKRSYARKEQGSTAAILHTTSAEKQHSNICSRPRPPQPNPPKYQTAKPPTHPNFYNDLTSTSSLICALSILPSTARIPHSRQVITPIFHPASPISLRRRPASNRRPQTNSVFSPYTTNQPQQNTKWQLPVSSP